MMEEQVMRMRGLAWTSARRGGEVVLISSIPEEETDELVAQPCTGHTLHLL